MSRRAPEPVYGTAVILGRALFGSLRLRLVASGRDRIPDAGGAVIAMTHFGYLEFALVEWATWLHSRRRIRFMAKKGAFDQPGVGWVLRRMHHIEVDMAAGAAAYADAVRALRAGELVGVFPEAGVSASFRVRELKTGAARLAAEAGVPIVPVAVWGGHRLLTKNRRIRMRDRIGVPVHMAVGERIPVPAAADPRAVTDALRTELQDLVDGLQATYPVDGRGAWWQPRHLGGTAPTPEEAAAADAERDERRRRRAEGR
ncbi:lysophospholipid acyltransferase family protein [Clavibacter zhangzhiyongii]|uniref:lysophospholipid acyltransferase family protein n=1 Tax=Clavibacter zhangzhiyongii TaxID=2768071 RepID=UPI0039E0C2C6